MSKRSQAEALAAFAPTNDDDATLQAALATLATDGDQAPVAPVELSRDQRIANRLAVALNAAKDLASLKGETDEVNAARRVANRVLSATFCSAYLDSQHIVLCDDLAEKLGETAFRSVRTVLSTARGLCKALDSDVARPVIHATKASVTSVTIGGHSHMDLSREHIAMLAEPAEGDTPLSTVARLIVRPYEAGWTRDGSGHVVDQRGAYVGPSAELRETATDYRKVVGHADFYAAMLADEGMRAELRTLLDMAESDSLQKMAA